MDIWSHQRAVANRDHTGVQETGVEVDVDILSEFNVITIVHGERGFNPGVVAKELGIFLLCGSLRGQRRLVLDDADCDVKMK